MWFISRSVSYFFWFWPVLYVFWTRSYSLDFIQRKKTEQDVSPLIDRYDPDKELNDLIEEGESEEVYKQGYGNF